ncbi:hypothetical protein LDJ79_20490, partial [Vibrio tritonius]
KIGLNICPELVDHNTRYLARERAGVRRSYCVCGIFRDLAFVIFNHHRLKVQVFVAAISIRPPPSLEGGLGRELARDEVTVFKVFIWLLFQF